MNWGDPAWVRWQYLHRTAYLRTITDEELAAISLRFAQAIRKMTVSMKQATEAMQATSRAIAAVDFSIKEQA